MNPAPENPPAWRADDRAGSLREFAAWLNARARATFLQDREHVALFFLFGDDGMVSIEPVPPGVGSEAVVTAVKEAIRQHHLYGLLQVAEAWAYLPGRPGDHTYRQIVEGEIAVSELKPEDRTEVLMVRLESRDGDGALWCSPILRRENAVELGDARVDEGPVAGRQGRLFD